jgi:AcrR family transcriptional regulator
MQKPAGHYHHGDLRAALLERAEQHIGVIGISDLSLRQLAKELGVSHDAPRRHFANKNELLNALAEVGFVRLANEVHAALGSARGSFGSRLLVFVKTYVGFARKHPALLEVMFATKTHSGAATLQHVNDQAFTLPVALIAEGQEAGEVLPGDPDRVYMALWAMMQGLATLVTGGWLDDRDPDEVLTSATEILVRGLRPTSPG